MIKILDRFVADKIAAGEVIERPLSIVKELVENSIDAGASQIIVEIRNGGKSYLRVTDNGSGIPEEEVRIAFARHATGKISKLADLDAIATLGFRGEALASIAAISRLTIYTKTKEAAVGTKLILHGGVEVACEQSGMNDGTTMVIEEVFYNTPARRKFMKSDAAEASVIIDMVQKLAIYYANIAFKLINNGQTVLATVGRGDRREAIMSTYPTYRDLIEIRGDFVSGYISDPGNTRSSRRGQIFFVNGRIIKSETIEKGIRDGYGDRLFSGHPIAILFLQVDPATIDVNIHPNKKELKFLDGAAIAKDIAAAIRAVFFSQNAIPAAGPHLEPAPAEEKEAVLSEQVDIKRYLQVRERPEIVDFTKEDTHAIIKENFTEEKAASTNTDEEKDASASHARIEIAVPPLVPFDFEELTLKGYVLDTYIILQHGETVYVLDQHAAHERILYERLIGRYNSEEHRAQPMLLPITIEISSDIYHAEQTHLDTLRRLGYAIEDFGRNTFLIREIPEYMERGEAERFARTLIEDGEIERNTIVADKLIMRSCKAAVKGHDRLSEREIHELLAQLRACINPFSCPHGRPTFVKITKYEIERAFKR